jgi:hypothetical protein
MHCPGCFECGYVCLPDAILLPLSATAAITWSGAERFPAPPPLKPRPGLFERQEQQRTAFYQADLNYFENVLVSLDKCKKLAYAHNTGTYG